MAYIGNSPVQDETVSSAQIIDGAIVNADINSSAAIAISKTALVAGTGVTLSTNTLNLDAAQTGFTSLLNTSLVVGRDADNQIKFSTDDQIIFRVGGGDGVTMKASGEIEATSLDISGDIDVDGTTNLDAVDIDGNVDIAGTFAVSHSSDFGSFTSTLQYPILKLNSTYGSAAGNGYLDFQRDGTTAARIYQTNQELRFATGGTSDAVTIDSSQRVGIGVTSPAYPLDIVSTINNGAALAIRGDVDADGRFSGIQFGDNGTTSYSKGGIFYEGKDAYARGNLHFALEGGTGTDNADLSDARMTITYDGKVFIGSTSSRTLSGVPPQMQIEGTDYGTSSMSLIGNTGTDAGTCPLLMFGRSRGTSDGTSTSVADGDRLGAIFFTGADGTDINTVGAYIEARADGSVSGNTMPGRIQFYTNSGGSSASEKMRISSLGEVFINRTASPSGMLNINTADGRYGMMVDDTFGNNALCLFRDDGTGVGSITIVSGNTAFNTTSDYRLKENQVTLANGLTRLNQLKPYNYNFIAHPDIVQDGFFAHEVAEVVPVAVTGEKDAVNDNGDIEPQQLDNSKLVPLLVKAVQELSAKVEVLEGN